MIRELPIPNDATECRVYLGDDGTVTVLVVEGISPVAVDGGRDRYHEVARGPMITLAREEVPAWLQDFMDLKLSAPRWVTTGERLHRAFAWREEQEAWYAEQKSRADLLAGTR